MGDSAGKLIRPILKDKVELARRAFDAFSNWDGFAPVEIAHSDIEFFASTGELADQDGPSSKKFGVRRKKPSEGASLHDGLEWVGNGMQDVIPEFVASPVGIAGAIYHLTDKEWLIPL